LVTTTPSSGRSSSSDMHWRRNSVMVTFMTQVYINLYIWSGCPAVVRSRNAGEFWRFGPCSTGPALWYEVGVPAPQHAARNRTFSHAATNRCKAIYTESQPKPRPGKFTLRYGQRALPHDSKPPYLYVRAAYKTCRPVPYFRIQSPHFKAPAVPQMRWVEFQMTVPRPTPVPYPKIKSRTLEEIHRT